MSQRAKLFKAEKQFIHHSVSQPSVVRDEMKNNGFVLKVKLELEI
jgi:hypothetical protein